MKSSGSAQNGRLKGEELSILENDVPETVQVIEKSACDAVIAALIAEVDFERRCRKSAEDALLKISQAQAKGGA